MQRCGSSHGNTLGPCPCNGPFHIQPNSYSMLFSPPSDHEPSSSAVDCTLSLGTPSTRGLPTADVEKRAQNRACVTNFCWDLLQVKHAPQSGYKAARNGGAGGSDPLLVRRCANCDTTSTPLWRNGPRGPKSLCNACGIRFKKGERRASGASIGNSAATSAAMWVPLPQSQKSPCFSPAIGSEFTLAGGEDSGPGVPFLSWRLNVTDRPSLVHDFTR